MYREDLLPKAKVGDKLMTLKEAVKKFVNDGDVLTPCGTAQMTPMALTMEIIRQRKRGLTVATTGNLDNVDILVGAGCVDKLELAYVATHYGRRGARPAPCLRRAVEHGVPRKVVIEDYSNLTMTLRFLAGALRLPFIPTRSLKGSDLASKATWRGDKKLALVKSPFTEEEVVVVPPCNPDVAIVHCQLADREGNAQRWGALASDGWAVKASKKIIVSAEKIVDSDVIRKNPNLTFIPGFMVDAVVEAPFGAHWWACQGFYDYDPEFQAMYVEMASKQETFEKFLEEWVFGVEDHQGYLKKLGEERLERLRVKEHVYSSPVDYGFR